MLPQQWLNPKHCERVESDSLPVGQIKITQAGQDDVRTIVTRQLR